MREHRRVHARACAVHLLVVGFVLACSGDSSGPTGNPPPQQQTPSGVVVPLEVFGASGGTPGAACTGAKYREFDFWVGNWNIRNPSDQPAGVSVISKVLSGCAITEFFAGGAGQSLNVYDATTDTWNQFYLFPSPGISLLRGGLVSGEMVLSEQRTPTFLDRWTWTPTHADTVWQREQLTINGVTMPGFQGKYIRRADVPPSPAVNGPGCPPNALAFIVGSWEVYEGDPTTQGTLRGTMTATSELRGCGIIERISGAAGFSGLSFAGFHPGQGMVLREYMDSDGRYLRLAGTSQGANLVMTGARQALDGSTVTVRLTWEPVSANEFKQVWEFSTDGGSTFANRRELRFIK